jgi:pyrimidine-nucleoside phosphorylase
MLRAVDIIRKKRDGQPLSPAEIEAFVHGAVHGSWADYQLSALLMAIFFRGMTSAECAVLTQAMTVSGQLLDWPDMPGPVVDKHSTGGVGDKTSFILAPLAACCGVFVPMVPGRGLGNCGGTLDKIEAVPGFRHQLSLAEFRDAVRKLCWALVGQTPELAPADRRLYSLRDVTATVESIPLITASILSKKLAEGLAGLVLDVKCGRGAYMKDRDSATQLAQSLMTTAQANGLRTQTLITSMDAPLGCAVGNALEIKEAIEVLQGRGDHRLKSLSIHLAARMLVLGGMATIEAASERIEAALSSGQGLEKFRAVIENQGGDPRVIDDVGLLPTAPHRYLLRAERPGYVVDIDADKVGLAAMHLGAGRAHVGDTIDPAVGCVLTSAIGTAIRAGEVLAEIHYRSDDRLAVSMPLFRRAWTIGDEKAEPADLILDDSKYSSRSA